MSSGNERLPSLLKEFLIQYLNNELLTPVQSSPNSTSNGKKTIIADDTPEPLSETSIPCFSIWFQTPVTNSNFVYIGGENVNENACRVSPNSNGFIDISNLNSLYVYGKAGDEILYTYTYN